MAEQLLQLLFSGITLGGIYALVGIILVSVYNVTGILNLAQGEFIAIGGLLAVSLYAKGLPMTLVFILAVMITAILGGLLERLSLNRVSGASGLALLIITIGLSISLRGLALLIWGTDTYALPSFLERDSLMIGGAAFNSQTFFVYILVITILLALAGFFNLTYWGKAVRASVLNRTGARLQGINHRTISFLAFVAAGGLGAAAGICMAPISMVTYDMGFMLCVKGFVAAAAGGLSSVSGALLGGLLLGILEAFGAGLISSGFKDAIAIIILLAILLFRPQGIMGAVKERKI